MIDSVSTFHQVIEFQIENSFTPSPGFDNINSSFFCSGSTSTNSSSINVVIVMVAVAMVITVRSI